MIKLILRLYTHVRTHFFQTTILVAALGALVRGFVYKDQDDFRTAIIIISTYAALLEIKDEL